jgi:hypothetical protein
MKNLFCLNPTALLIASVSISISCSVISSGATAQEALEGLVETRVPTSPALNLLGGSPTVINDTATPKALGFSLLENLSDSGGDFLGNLAVEFSPYWWFPHPEVSYDDYYEGTDGFGEAILPTLSVSLATRTGLVFDNGNQVDGTSLGMGLRFNLLAGSINPELQREVEEYLELDKVCNSELQEFILESLGENPTVEEFEELKRNFTCSIQEERDDAFQGLRELKNENERVGFKLEFATASTFDAPDNDFDRIEFSKFATWLTASYLPVNPEDREAQPVSFLGLARYGINSSTDDEETIFDLGGRVIYKPEAEPNLSLSFEYVRRFAEDDGDNRIVGGVEYKINDTYSAFASFGRGFENAFGEDNLVTIFGVNLGFGKGPILTIPGTNPEANAAGN